MKPIYIFRHIDIEGPGVLGDYLAQQRIPCQLVKVDAGESIPGNTCEMGVLVLLGGPMSVNEPHAWIEQELDIIREAAARGLPILGHCLGAQLISKAMGGSISANADKEIGWFEVTCTMPSWCAELPHRFAAFHWHGETFTNPTGTVSLFKSDYCANQGFACGNILALQFHLEVTAAMIPQWCQRYHVELASRTGIASVQTAEQMVADLERHLDVMQQNARLIYGHWLRQGGLIQG